MPDKKPTIRPGPASRYAGPRESIYEFSDPVTGLGGLLSLRRQDGRLVIDVYHADHGVTVLGPPPLKGTAS